MEDQARGNQVHSHFYDIPNDDYRRWPGRVFYNVIPKVFDPRDNGHNELSTESSKYKTEAKSESRYRLEYWLIVSHW